MNIRTALTMAGLAAVVAVTGCARHAPSIAHVHIGHAMTGWHDTPEQQGLLTTAEKKAHEAQRAAQRAKTPGRGLQAVKTDVRMAVVATSTQGKAGSGPRRYGVQQALRGALDHLAYAADAADASANVKGFAGRFEGNAAVIFERCDLIVALGNDVAAASTRQEAFALAGEIAKLARANLFGEDINRDGVKGSTPAEYGMVQLRRDIARAVDQEDPPYTTVDRWYLFNLIRLPDGNWAFRNKAYEGPEDVYGGGGGGGGGY